MIKKILPLIFPIVLLITVGFYSVLYVTTISVVQTVPPESLAIGHDRSLHVNDTVTITGRVIAPPKVNFSGGDRRLLLRGLTSWTAYIQDTTNTIWGGIVVRQADTVHNTLFDQLDSGTKVRITGTIQEFPDIPSSGLTQINLDTLSQVQILSTVKKRPAPINLTVSVFDSLGTCRFSTGEKYEGMYVQLKNVTVGDQSGSGQRNIRRLIDAQGNFIYLRDFSNFFSLAPNGSGWSAWVPPPTGAVIDSISGVIINSAYTDGTFNGNPVYPYVLVPIYPNDFHLGNAPPSIGSVSRNPGVPKPADSVQVTATVTDSSLSRSSVTNVQVFYRVNRGAYTPLACSNTGNIYFIKIPSKPLGNLVEYFVKATDNNGAYRLSPQDTSKSTYFYYVRSSDTMTIKDVQYTPNNGGFSAYNGYTVTTEGIVTADTSDIPAFSFTSAGGSQTSPRRVIIQDPNIAGGWSGIWISGNATDPLVKGQRVRIRGVVTEVNTVTSIAVATSGDIVVVSSGNPLPTPENLSPGIVADTKVDGDTTAEKWESVLVKFPNPCIISCVNVASGAACTGQLQLPDSTFRRNFGEIYVMYQSEGVAARVELQDGHHKYVNGWDPAKANYYNPVQPPWQLLYQWDGMTGLTGIMFEGFGHYKLVPRRDNDWGSVIAVEHISEVATSYWLRQNYPNPFNPQTQIVYNIPATSEVTLKVYNLLGQEVRTLVDGLQNKGKYSIPFDGLNLASGIYVYFIDAKSLEGISFRDVKKMVLIK